MDYLIYSINIEETRIQLVKNPFGFCVCINIGVHMNVFVHASLN